MLECIAIFISNLETGFRENGVLCSVGFTLQDKLSLPASVADILEFT